MSQSEPDARRSLPEIPVSMFLPSEAQTLPPASKRVLVSYESSAHGQAALRHALLLAREGGAGVLVLSVATRERVDVGCASCRQSAALWNREMRLIAHEALAEAAAVVGPSCTVEYLVAFGKPKQAIADAAARVGADVIVVPSQPKGRRRVSFSTTTIVEYLRRDGRWEVVVAPASVAEARRRHR